MGQHTPGPWSMPDEGEEFRYYVFQRDRCIADCNQESDMPKEEAEANARLIAAAPDLVAALEGLMLGDEHAPGCPGAKYHDRPEHDCPAIRKCVAARAAIAKAKGEAR